MEMFEIVKPKAYKDVNVSRTIRFTPELFEELGKTAQEHGVSVNFLVNQCCRYALDNLKENEDR